MIRRAWPLVRAVSVLRLLCRDQSALSGRSNGRLNLSLLTADQSNAPPVAALLQRG